MARKYVAVKVNPCRNCGAELDVASDINNEGKVPHDGDFSICGECHTLSVFTDDMSLRAPTEEEKINFLTSIASHL